MKRKITKTSLIISLAFTLAVVTPQSQAEEEFPTNAPSLNNFYYPNHTCGQKSIRPIKPASAESFKDKKEYNTTISSYNLQVSNYNAEIKFYKSCINRYIKNGNHDINIIKQRLDTALEEARSKK
jgi:hypothetical protein